MKLEIKRAASVGLRMQDLQKGQWFTLKDPLYKGMLFYYSPAEPTGGFEPLLCFGRSGGWPSTSPIDIEDFRSWDPNLEAEIVQIDKVQITYK